MPQLIIPNDIANGQGIDGSKLEENFNAIENAVNAIPVGTPIGMVNIYAGASAPAGWELCQGQQKSRTEFNALFSVIGTTYGAGDGSTTFNVPNLKGRVVMALDGSQTAFNALGKTGGSKDAVVVTHDHPQTPHAHAMPHSHTMNHDHPQVNTSTAGDHVHYGVWLNKSGNSSANTANGTMTGTGGTDPLGDHAHTVNLPSYSGSTGGVSTPNTSNSAAVDTGNPVGSVVGTDKNLPPYQVLNYIIRVT